MKQGLVIGIVLLLAVGGILGFVFATDGAQIPAETTAGIVQPPAVSAPVAVPAIAVETKAPAAVTPDDVASWTTDATGGDADKRAAAITALSRAPVEQALPILRRVLMNGEAAVDRPLALQSLRDLALNQGDPQSAIRNTIREAIYHGDDLTMAGDAQEALDVIEEGLAK
ncbi:MAG: hypothetical protein WDO72_17595 [Pseudomonadota bacterium]